MAMKLPRVADDDEAGLATEMNTTPLIDVMLVLLVMLIITIPLPIHTVRMDLPVGTPPPVQALPEVVKINVDFDGRILWNDSALADRGDLEAHLRAIAAQAVAPEVHLSVNDDAPYQFVAEVLAAAQRLGVGKIGIVAP